MNLFQDSIVTKFLAGAMTFLGMAFAHTSLYVSDEQVAQASPPLVIAPELPSHLFIPSLEINANIQHVGLTTTGAMASPKGFVDAGWYRHGVIPGQEGGAVFAGHLDNGLALPGVFKNLAKVGIGADVYVTTEEKTTLHFVVTDVDSYDYKNTPDELVFNDRGPGSRIRLITCVGKWVQADKTYDKRLVVTAKLVP
ncbi:MAG: class F sortase [Patescibacteria group bacterium]